MRMKRCNLASQWLTMAVLTSLVFAESLSAAVTSTVRIDNYLPGGTLGSSLSDGESSPTGATAFLSYAEASGAAFTHDSGTVYASADFSSGGRLTATIAAVHDEEELVPPVLYDAQEVNSNNFWTKTFTSSATVNHRFAFHMQRTSVTVVDEVGEYTLNEPFEADVGVEIRFGLGAGPLTSSQTIYSFDMRLDAAGTNAVSEFVLVNPQGAASPNFVNGDPAVNAFHQFYSDPFDGVLNLGVIAAGQQFTLEYRSYSRVFGPGISETGQLTNAHAQIGDPFNVQAGNLPLQFTILTQQQAVPEPSTLAGLLLGLPALALAIRKRRVR